MSSPDPSATFVYAHEIENGIVSVAWHHPSFLAIIQRDLDLELHFTQPHLRYLIEALSLAYSELGTTDFSVVIETLRETGRLLDCGGKQGLNELYELFLYGQDQNRFELIFAYFLERLQTYAVARTDGTTAPARFLGGKGTISPNKVKRNVHSPDYAGSIRISGRIYDVALWINPRGEFVNLTFLPSATT
jgi:hypothetical protein